MSFYHPEAWSYIAVTGMGLLPGLACPHFNGHTAGVPRRDDFHAMLRRTGGPGLALDDLSAIAFVGAEYRVLSATREAAAYSHAVRRGRIVERRLPAGPDYRPARELFPAE
jgi:dipeptidase E